MHTAGQIGPAHLNLWSFPHERPDHPLPLHRLRGCHMHLRLPDAIARRLELPVRLPAGQAVPVRFALNHS